MPYDINFRIEKIARGNMNTITQQDREILLPHIAQKQFHITVEEVNTLMKLIIHLFIETLASKGYKEREIQALRTKFRDAGRRSAPWQPTSSRLPGRPQDGSDGNRQNRWLFPTDHKFYADEITATFVEIKYYLQALSMHNAPSIAPELQNLFTPWLLEHPVIPGEYLDPIQLIHIDFREFINYPRGIQSGHIFPLDRGGRHEPSNTFLMLAKSNQIQGNQTMNELINTLREIVAKHDEALRTGSSLEHRIRQ
jgi:hypothetical protein